MYQKKMNKHIYGGEDNLSVSSIWYSTNGYFLVFKTHEVRYFTSPCATDERRDEFYGTDS